MDTTANATHAVPPRHYFTAIDGLRLIAAVNIVLFHGEAAGGFYEMQGRPWWFFLVVKGPAFHASLFFILGGFIFTIKHAAQAATLRTREFVGRRLLQLYPLHVVMTLAMVPFSIMGATGTPSQVASHVGASTFMHLSLLWPFYPFGTHALNRPSWALAAFFFCYLLFGPALRRVVRLQNRRSVLAACAGCCGVVLAWSLVYGAVVARMGYSSDTYWFFHVFPPIRFVEFVLGMLLARLYQVSTYKTGGRSIWNHPIGNDLIIAGTVVLLLANLLLQSRGSDVVRFLGYHAVALPLFALLVYRFARGSGVFARFTSIPLVRALGQCSFYPYLLHIPVMSWGCWLLSRYLGYRTVLHSPVNIWLMVAVLYGGSCMYFEWVGRARRKARAEARAS